jgi:hypothetical protein
MVEWLGLCAVGNRSTQCCDGQRITSGDTGSSNSGTPYLLLLSSLLLFSFSVTFTLSFLSFFFSLFLHSFSLRQKILLCNILCGFLLSINWLREVFDPASWNPLSTHIHYSAYATISLLSIYAWTKANKASPSMAEQRQQTERIVAQQQPPQQPVVTTPKDITKDDSTTTGPKASSKRTTKKSKTTDNNTRLQRPKVE